MEESTTSVFCQGSTVMPLIWLSPAVALEVSNHVALCCAMCSFFDVLEVSKPLCPEPIVTVALVEGLSGHCIEDLTLGICRESMSDGA